MPPHIPPEITDAIISAVDDPHTLTRCALVCRDWLPASRANLFKDIRITNGRSYALLVERVLHSEHMGQYLTSARSLCITDDREHSLSSGGRLSLVEFAGKLPGLRELHVTSMDWTQQRPSVKWPLLLAHFGTITSLTLHSCRFASFTDVRRLLTALPRLSALAIWRLRWPTVPQQLMHLHTAPRSRACWPELHALRIDYDDEDPPQCTQTLLRWITVALGGSAVRELSFGIPPTGSLREIAVAFVGRVGRSVTSLTVYLQVADHLPLSGLVALEHLSLKSYGYQGYWRGVASVLKDVSSKRMRSIMINPVYTSKYRGDVEAPLYLDDDTIEEFDRILSREPFGTLEEVVFHVLADSEDREEEELLRAHARRCLPKLHERKIFCLEFGEL
ncbi:hypothetical protein L226DRAFT_526628 [Lentinus tigrinus ALCF2SS1-7]|uniref:uncharacterized protein n=1 Tax=Lentinus tigrinus ALCF2SS1-7 TaxID=1328758 RepID=UPI0011661EDE|nr:hypothetical protein L226DRAFT_526628 [Lentinus tigrinus ALCF2SS1-7]